MLKREGERERGVPLCELSAETFATSSSSSSSVRFIQNRNDFVIPGNTLCCPSIFGGHLQWPVNDSAGWDPGRRKDEQFDGKQMHLAREWKFQSLLRFESCVDCFGPSRFVLRTAIKDEGSLGAGERIISVVAEPLPEQWKIRPLVIINQLNRPRLNYNDRKWRKRRRRRRRN